VTIETQIVPLDGELPRVSFRWDSKTEILAGAMAPQSGTGSGSRTIELGGSHGSYLSLDLVDNMLAGIEVVVWPQGDVVDHLDVPSPDRRGMLRVIRGGSGNDPAVVELGQPLSCLRTADESTVHIRLSGADSGGVVAVADNLLAEIDVAGQLTALWLLDVPPFPGVKKTG
jgi:hypothetical protein